MKKIILICAFIILCVEGLCGTDNHVIVSIDLKSNIAKYECDYTVSEIKKIVPQILKENDIHGGYASMHFFSAHSDASDLDTYIEDIITPFAPYTDISSVLANLDKNDFTNHKGEYYSIISVATPYSLLRFRNTKPDILVQNTYIVLVTDYKYNGNNDFYGELQHVKGITEPTRAAIMDIVKDVQQNYFYKFIGEKTLSVNSRKAYISLFEAVPLQQYFAIETLLDFPHTITAKRTKDGYVAEFEINQLDNPNYRFVSSEACMPINGYDQKRPLSIGKEEIFVIPEKLVEQVGKDNLSINFSTRVHFIDNVYNHTLLAPEGSRLHGSEGLKRNVKIILEEDAKILGFIPLTDGLYKMSFWTGDQHIAAITWNLILILILGGILIYIIWKSTQYNTNDHEVKI